MELSVLEFEEQANKSGLIVAKRWNWAWLDGFYRFDNKEAAL